MLQGEMLVFVCEESSFPNTTQLLKPAARNDIIGNKWTLP